MKNGLMIENDIPVYYEKGQPVHKGILKINKDIYYIGKNGQAVRGEKYVHTSMTNHLVRHGTYYFGDDYKMLQGVVFENGEPVYYENGQPKHKGIVKSGDDMYYFGSQGRAVTGKKFVHSSMTNRLVEHGTYQFGSDYKMNKDFFIPVKESSHKRSGKHKKHHSHRISSRRKKKYIRLGIACCAAVILIFAAAFIISYLTEDHSVPDKNLSTASRSSQVLTVNVPEMNEEVWLVKAAAKQNYTASKEAAAVVSDSLYEPLNFSYDVGCSDPLQRDDVTAALFLSENPSMEDEKRFEANSSAGYVTVDNLKVDTTYYYRFEASVGDEKQTCEGSFKTAATHRFLYLPNVANIRDVGGRKTTDGKAIRQNMLIRGTEIDGLVENSYYLLDDYVDYAREEFGFKSEMDLRTKNIGYTGYQSRFGAEVNHRFYGAPSYSGVLSEANLPIMKEMFSFLADKSNYPIYVHCTYGVDRTGTLIYLLDAILGLSEEEMDMEYELSNVSTEKLVPLKTALASYKGDTINEKIENYLIDSVGVTPEEIASIRSILLTD